MMLAFGFPAGFGACAVFAVAAMIIAAMTRDLSLRSAN
jgi:hypothetical protein